MVLRDYAEFVNARRRRRRAIDRGRAVGAVLLLAAMFVGGAWQ